MSPPRSRRLIAVGAIAVCALVAPARKAPAQVMIDYFAGTGSTAFDPQLWYWYAHNIGPGAAHQGLPVVNDLSSGFNAWGINDNSTSTVNPFYSECIDPPLPTGACGVGVVSAAAKQYGWRYSASARFVGEHNNTGGSMGLALWLENRGYFVLFDLDGANLRATLFNGTTPATILLTTGGNGATAYHDFALSYSPVTKLVALEFDGVNRAFTSGVSQAHDNALLWGNVSTSGRGQMNFCSVAFEVLLPGDYNRDNYVDTADYTVWRNSAGTNFAAADGDGNGIVNTADFSFWKRRFGDYGPLVFELGAAAPEPGLLALLLALAPASAFIRRRTC